MALKLDLAPFYDALATSMQVATAEFAAIAEEEIEAEQWRWPRETIRSGGFVVGEPRDIVDTGALRDSVMIAINPGNPLETAVGYAVDYAPDVHEGQYKGRFYLPGRPWLETAEQRFDLAEFVAGEMQQL